MLEWHLRSPVAIGGVLSYLPATLDQLSISRYAIIRLSPSSIISYSNRASFLISLHRTDGTKSFNAIEGPVPHGPLPLFVLLRFIILILAVTPNSHAQWRPPSFIKVLVLFLSS